jgi:hypothetical protein
MKITVKKVIETNEETELDLPYFFKLRYSSAGDVYYAIFDEERSMTASPTSGINCQPSCTITQFLSHERFAPSTEKEFTEAFEATIDFATSQLPVTA